MTWYGLLERFVLPNLSAAISIVHLRSRGSFQRFLQPHPATTGSSKSSGSDHSNPRRHPKPKNTFCCKIIFLVLLPLKNVSIVHATIYSITIKKKKKFWKTVSNFYTRLNYCFWWQFQILIFWIFGRIFPSAINSKHTRKTIFAINLDGYFKTHFKTTKK